MTYELPEYARIALDMVPSKDESHVAYAAIVKMFWAGNPDRIRTIIDLARTDKFAYKVACHIAWECLKDDIPMIDELRLFAAGVIGGTFVTKHSTGTPLLQNLVHDGMIQVAVEQLIKTGKYHRTRNEAGTSENLSACDIVVDELIRRGHPASYFKIEKITRPGYTRKKLDLPL
jgi:hypothetical protein